MKTTLLKLALGLTVAAMGAMPAGAGDYGGGLKGLRGSYVPVPAPHPIPDYRAKWYLRGDLGVIPQWLGWGSSAMQFLIGVVLIGLALREAVPGRAVPPGAAVGALVLGFAFQLAVSVATWVASPGPAFSWAGFTGGVVCMRNEITFALPALIVTLWLVVRALPLRPAMAGAFGGTGAGLVADGINHLLCPMSDLRHVVAWHTGAVLLLALAGWLAGSLWERARRPS